MKNSDEYELMMKSQKRNVYIQIPNGPKVLCRNSWDYVNNLTQTSVKTMQIIDTKHPLLTKVKIDMKPFTSKDAWQIIVLRQPKSELLDESKNKNRN